MYSQSEDVISQGGDRIQTADFTRVRRKIIQNEDAAWSGDTLKSGDNIQRGNTILNVVTILYR